MAGMYVYSKCGFKVLRKEDDLVVLEATRVNGLYIVNRIVGHSLSLETRRAAP